MIINFFLEREGKDDEDVVFGVGGERRTNWVPKNLDESIEFEVEAMFLKMSYDGYELCMK